MKQSALIIDDDRSERRMLATMLAQRFDLSSIEAESGQKALILLSQESSGKIGVILLDLNMPVMSGLETLREIKIAYPEIPVIILTGSGRMEDAVQAMKMNAADFFTKPAHLETIGHCIQNLLKTALRRKDFPKSRQKRGVSLFKDLVGHDTGLCQSVSLGMKAASCDFPVLIEGKTGTGKEVFASAIHGESARSPKPFIAINCGAIPEKLVESTLFGHEKGSFTGATSKNTGKFQEADGGTIFLDEIGELPLEAQVKLLRVLQEKEVDPVGSTKPVPINVRIISATNRNLLEEVRKGRFREDLYYRLNVLSIILPSLADRKEDIPALMRHFIEKFCDNQNIPAKVIPEDTIRILIQYGWPGNIRELENFTNRLMIMGNEPFLAAGLLSLPSANDESHGQNPNASVHLLQEDGTMKSFGTIEQEIIRKALSYHSNNISLTARVLGFAKSTLYAKLNGMSDIKARNG